MTNKSKHHSPTSPRKGRILVVEDDFPSRELLRVILELEHHVEATDSGESALKILRETDFDLVLLDIMMGGIDGIEVLRTIRAADATRDLPVILVSALTDSKVMVEGLEAGASDYLTKPIDPPVLIARVHTQLKLKFLSDERNKHIEELERAENLRTQFTRIASHDLKNPIHNLAIATALLKDDLENDPRFMQIINMLDLTVENMHHIIEDFLDVVAIQSDTLELKPDVLNISDVMNNVAMQYEIAAEEKDIHLKLHNKIGRIVADNARMVQIVNNLVSNAIKYSQPGSTITLWTEIRGEMLRLCVKDEGPGIPEEERHMLFTEFGKLSTRPTGNEARTGLGLWIVKHLMEKQGGKVGATFPEDGGSIFWLELPAVTEPSLAYVIEESA